ncbi:MAG: hypothetical protein Q9172_003417 [Xanthocarpia lactea]
MDVARGDNLGSWSSLGIHKVSDEDTDKIFNMIYHEYPASRCESLSLPFWVGETPSGILLKRLVPELRKPHQAPSEYFSKLGLAQHVFSIASESAKSHTRYYIGMDKLNLAIMSQHKQLTNASAGNKRKPSDTVEAEHPPIVVDRSTGEKARNNTVKKRLRFSEPEVVNATKQVAQATEKARCPLLEIRAQAPKSDEKGRTFYRFVEVEKANEQETAPQYEATACPPSVR